mgnify:CR=1 FL=1
MSSRWVFKRNNPFWKKKLTPEKLTLALLWNRGIKGKKATKQFLFPPLPAEISLAQAGIDPKQVKKACLRLKQAQIKKERILVYGDYDVDGFCSTALLWEALYFANFNAFPYIPNREKDGYGLNADTVKKLKAEIPGLGLVITVDNGIVANEAVKELKKQGIDTIIVDHHLPSKTLPKALSIIHTTKLAGSGVVWFLVCQLADLGAPLPDLGLAALGTVADMLPVKGVSRSLIKHGTPYLETTRRVGLRSLFSLAGIRGQPIDTFKIGFIIAPRLNALGRIADPMDGLRLLCSRRLIKGERLAKLAQKVNTQRQKMTKDSLQEAREKVGKGKLPELLFVASSSFHQGIVGLIAGRLMDEFYRPAIVIKKEKGISRGSVRSIKELNIIQALRSFKGLFVELGGHPQAAGFKIKTKNIPVLKKKLLSLVKQKLKGKKLQPRLGIDGCLNLSQASSPDYYQAIAKLSPFGLGNRQPIFLLKNLRIVELRKAGSNGNHLKLILDDPDTPLEERAVAEAIGFNLGSWGDKLSMGDLVDLAANLTENHWKGKTSVVLQVKDLRLRGKVVK